MLGPRGMHSSTTKQLINRYESMSPGPTTRPLDGLSTASTGPCPPKVPDTTLPFDTQKKEKSPIRQSFRNLFSVFKKANYRKGKQDEDRPLSSFRRHQPVVNDLPSFSAPPVLRSRSRKLTSSLLYLSRPPQIQSNSPILPVWTSCTATLESDSIVISSLTACGNPSTQTIQLSNCTDVRSLSMQQLDPAESALLPKRQENEELKVFEILFEGRPREKFAANSVQERAGWVSAVWETVLPTQDPSICAENKPQAAKMAEDLSSSNYSAAVPSQVATMSSIPSHRERSLPPVPVDTKPALLLDTHLLSVQSRTDSYSPISPSVYPPTRPVSRASSSEDSRKSRSNSPSIMNLSQLSVVRQRLAQIEPNCSQSSHGSLTSPTSSRASHSSGLTTPVLRSAKGSLTSPTDSQDMLRVQSASSSAADSILDSYGEAPAHKSIQPIQASLVRPAPEQMASVENLSDRSRSMTGKVPQPPSMMYPGLEPVVELLHDQSTKTYDQTANLGNQVLSLQNDIQRLPSEIISAISADAHSKTVLKMVAKVEEQARANGEAIGCIENTLKEKSLKRRGGASSDSANLAQELQSIREHIMQDLSHIRSKLHAVNHDCAASPTQLNNVAPFNGVGSVASPIVDLSGLHTKLDEILAASRAGASRENEQNLSSVNAAKIEDMLVNVIDLLQKDAGHQALHAHQQAESVRYLNELNTWLEAFVKNGTSQIQKLSTGVDQLCRDLGSVEGESTMLADIRQLALATAARDHNSAALQVSVDGLFAMLHEQAAASNVASIAALIDRQRHDHEGLLRALATEISGEIKGERLRFVEAMKEATAINVQIHVEQFKKELKREVVQMTDEVGRLHQDRQAMQNQIADLFAFYTKQKAAEFVQPHVTASAHEEQTRSTGRRPLPQPHH